MRTTTRSPSPAQPDSETAAIVVPACLLTLVSASRTIRLEEDQGARAFLTAVRESGASAADRKRLSTIMLNLASDAARRRLETMMTTMEWKSDFIDGYVHQGEVKAKAEDVLKIIDARKIDVTTQQREQVTSTTDTAQLDEWLDSAATADTATDIFKS